jgi:CheY-like chemotaxis protein
MKQPATRPSVIALINSTPDVIEMLRVAFEYAGFVVVSTYTFLIRQGEINIEAFIQQHQPEAIVYDIAPPYTSNWHLFEHISQLPGLKGRPFVLTSTNSARVRELAKTDEAIFEIVETPYQIMQLVDIVKQATRHLPAARSE